MAGEGYQPNVSLTDPNAAPAAGTSAPAAASASVPATAPDQSAAAPVTAAPAAGDPNVAAAQAQAAQAMANMRQAQSNITQLQQPDAPSAQGKHARLMSMIAGLAQGLGTGLSAAGASIGTHGAEGGAKEVAQIQGEQQRQQLAAKQQAMEAKNQAIQHQVTLLDTNMRMAQMIPMLYSLKNEMTKSDLEISGEKQKQSQSEADFRAGHGGLASDEFNKTLSDPTPVAAGDTAGPSAFFRNTAEQSYAAAAKVLGPNDPYVKNLRAALDNPQGVSARDLWNATGFADSQAKRQTAAADDALKLSNAASAQTSNTAYQAYAKSVPAGTTPMDQKTWESQQAALAKEKTPLGAAQLTDAQAGAQLKQITLDVSKAMNNPATANLSGDDFIKTLPPAAQNSVRMVGQGRFPMSANMLRSPEGQQFLNLVARAYPNFKQANVESYMKAQNDFTTGAIGTALNKGNAAVHGLETLKALNTNTSRIPGTADYQKYNNQLDTLVGEIANFYQLPETDKTIEAIKSNLGATFNRGAAINQQMHQMGVKFDQFENQWNEASILPGTLPMPGTDVKAKQIVAGIDPEYKANHPELQAAGGTAAPAATAAPKSVVPNPVTKQPQTVGHKVGDTITQQGHNLTVDSVDADGRVTGAH